MTRATHTPAGVLSDLRHLHRSGEIVMGVNGKFGEGRCGYCGQTPLLRTESPDDHGFLPEQRVTLAHVHEDHQCVTCADRDEWSDLCPAEWPCETRKLLDLLP